MRGVRLNPIINININVFNMTVSLRMIVGMYVWCM